MGWGRIFRFPIRGAGPGPPGISSCPFNVGWALAVDGYNPAMKKLLAATVSAVPLALVAAPIETMRDQVSAARIESNIRKLASFGTRNSLSDTESETRGIGAARRWIKAELERCGAGTRMSVA